MSKTNEAKNKDNNTTVDEEISIDGDKSPEFATLGIRSKLGLKIAIAYQDNLVQYITFEKFKELISKPDKTIVVENFIEANVNNGGGARGQLLATYFQTENTHKLVFVRGITGKIIRKHEDVIARYSFPISQGDLELFSNMAVHEILNKTVLDDLIEQYDALLEYEILEPCRK